ncbi:hypothetical protein AAFN86_29615, partial [Roseomonas sp. CAU 1739]
VARALVAVERSRPDLMIVDAHLRDGSGISAVREIIRSGFVPDAFVSGEDCSAYATSPGSVAIEKPYHPTELAEAIQCVLTSDHVAPELSGPLGAAASDLNG